MGDDKKIIAGCFGILTAMITLPLWYYLLYQILTRVEANTAMWAAYWTYAPISFISVFVLKFVEVYMKDD